MALNRLPAILSLREKWYPRSNEGALCSRLHFVNDIVLPYVAGNFHSDALSSFGVWDLFVFDFHGVNRLFDVGRAASNDNLIAFVEWGRQLDYSHAGFRVEVRDPTSFLICRFHTEFH